MAFNFTKVLTDIIAFPSKPGSGALARKQFQDMFDEVKNYMNNSLASVTQPAWVAATLQSNWVQNISGNYDLTGYMKDTLGYVHIRGSISGGTTTNGTVIFQLPAGYRPLAIHRYVVLGNSNTPSVIYIDASGNVTIQLSNGILWLEIPPFKAGE